MRGQGDSHRCKRWLHKLPPRTPRTRSAPWPRTAAWTSRAGVPARGPTTPQPHQQHLPGQHPEPGGLSGGCGPRASARARGTQHRGGRGAEDGPRADRTGQLRPGRQRLGLRKLGGSAACGRLFRWLPGSQRDLSRGHRSFMSSFHLYEACHSDRWPSRPSADAPRPL